MPHPVFVQLREHPDLPSPKGVALEILRLARRDDTSLQQLASVIETDPAIASRLLKAVNSPALAVGRMVSSIPQAAALLGLRVVTQVTLGFSILCEHRDGQCDGFDYQEFWSSSLARGSAMRRLARYHGEPCPEEAFICGLLSQIGRLALACVFPERYSRLLRDLQRDPSRDLLEDEREAFEIDHLTLSAEMMTDWHLMPGYCEAVRALAVRDVRAGLACPCPDLLQAQLALAADLAEVFVQRAVGRTFLTDVIHLAQATGIEPLDFIELYDQASEDWRVAGRIFTVATQPTLSIPELYTQARELQRRLEAQEPCAILDPLPGMPRPRPAAAPR